MIYKHATIVYILQEKKTNLNTLYQKRIPVQIQYGCTVTCFWVDTRIHMIYIYHSSSYASSASIITLISHLLFFICWVWFLETKSYDWSSITNLTSPIPTSNSTQTLPSLHLLHSHLILYHSLPPVLSFLP